MPETNVLNARSPAALIPVSALVGPGAHRLSEETYNADPCQQISVRASDLKTVRDRSPAHARLSHPRLNPKWEPDDRKMFDIGRTAHALVLGDLKAEFVLFDLPGWNHAKKEDKAARQAAYDAGQIPLLTEQFDRLQAMAKACHQQLAGLRDWDGTHIGNPLRDGHPESTLVWFDDEFDVWCRCRLDWCPNTIAADQVFYDFKSTSGSANPDGAYRHLNTIGADLQAVHYMRGIRAVYGIKAPRFRFIMQEVDEPFALSVSEPTELFMHEAEREYRRAMRLWSRCLKEGVFPGYPARVVSMDPPAWKVAQAEDRDVMDRVDREQQIDTFAQLLVWQGTGAVAKRPTLEE